MLLPFEGKSHQFKAKVKERGVFTVDSLLFQLDSFRQKEKFKSKFEK
jgi:hypothetical protein